jgi:hypothetical protein
MAPRSYIASGSNATKIAKNDPVVKIWRVSRHAKIAGNSVKKNVWSENIENDDLGCVMSRCIPLSAHVPVICERMGRFSHVVRQNGPSGW